MDHKLPSLDALGLKFGTDKSSVDHDYLTLYERYLQPMRQREITVLEIGVLGGGSLAMWEAYFPHARIVGADIDRDTLRFARERVAIEIVDQANVEQLTRLAIKHGPFDLVIEDGSHMWEHQITSLRTLFPFVRNGGFYIVEDLLTNYPLMAEKYRGAATTSCIEYLKKLLDVRVGGDKVDLSEEEDGFLKTYGRALASVTFARHVCLLEKFYQDEFDAAAYGPFKAVESDPRTVPVSLLAHLAGAGDVSSPSGWIRAARRKQGIQGFSLTCAGGEACPIAYRGRSSSGTWSAWASAGTFIGSRGKGDNLTGISLKLQPGSAAKFDLAVFCSFADTPEALSGTGGDFVSPSGRRLLSGLQVILRRK